MPRGRIRLFWAQMSQFLVHFFDFVTVPLCCDDFARIYKVVMDHSRFDYETVSMILFSCTLALKKDFGVSSRSNHWAERRWLLHRIHFSLHVVMRQCVIFAQFILIPFVKGFIFEIVGDSLKTYSKFRSNLSNRGMWIRLNQGFHFLKFLFPMTQSHHISKAVISTTKFVEPTFSSEFTSCSWAKNVAYIPSFFRCFSSHFVFLQEIAITYLFFIVVSTTLNISAQWRKTKL